MTLRALVNELFGCRDGKDCFRSLAACSREAVNLYRSRECGCVALECGRHGGFYVDADDVFLEILVEGRAAAPRGKGRGCRDGSFQLRHAANPLSNRRSGNAGRRCLRVSSSLPTKRLTRRSSRRRAVSTRWLEGGRVDAH